MSGSEMCVHQWTAPLQGALPSDALPRIEDSACAKCGLPWRDRNAVLPTSPARLDWTPDRVECPDCEGAGRIEQENSFGETVAYHDCPTCLGHGELDAERWAEAAVMSAFLSLGSWKDGTRDNEYAKDRLRWLFNKGAALRTPPAPLPREGAAALLAEALDLVPRISDDDPMAPALADWCRRVRAALTPAAQPTEGK